MASIRTLAAVALLLLIPLNSLVLIGSGTQSTPADNDGTCRMNMGICVDTLMGLLHWSVGLPDMDRKCCAFLGGMAGFEAAWCVCTIVKTNVNGVEIDIPLTTNMLMNHCGKEVPKDFRCA